MEDLIKAQRRSKKICKRMEEREELRLAALAEKLFASDDEDMGYGSDSYKGAREVDDAYVVDDDQDEDQKDESAGGGKSKVSHVRSFLILCFE